MNKARAQTCVSKLSFTFATSIVASIIGMLTIKSTAAVPFDFEAPFYDYLERVLTILVAPFFALNLVGWYSHNVLASAVYIICFALGIVSLIWWLYLIIKARRNWTVVLPTLVWVIAGTTPLFVISRGMRVERSEPIQQIDTNLNWHLSLSREPHHGPRRTIHLFSNGTILVHQWTNIIGGRISEGAANRTAEWFNDSPYRRIKLGNGGDGMSDFIRRIKVYRQDKIERVDLVEYWTRDLLRREDYLLYWLMGSEDMRALSIDYRDIDALEKMLTSETVDLDELFKALYELNSNLNNAND